MSSNVTVPLEQGAPFALAVSAATDVGLVRAMNEDSYIASDPIFLVADGMGGHNAGEVASAIVIDEFDALTGSAFIDIEAVADAMVRAYERIASIASDGGRNAGTTVAMVALTIHEEEPHWLVMNLGDSRVYAIQNNEFTQVSVDHSVVQELVDRGEITEAQARVHPYRNMITRALGAGPDTRPDFWLIPVNIGDRFLICSDGVSGEVEDSRIELALRSEDGTANIAKVLVAEAVANGGRDNATAVVVEAVEPHAATGERSFFTTVDRSLLPQLPMADEGFDSGVVPSDT